jgi:hypothetical protein
MLVQSVMSISFNTKNVPPIPWVNSIFPLLQEGFKYQIIHSVILESIATFSLASDSFLIHDPDFTAKEAAGPESEWGWGLEDRLRWCINYEYSWFTHTDQESLLEVSFGDRGEQWIRKLFCQPSDEQYLLENINETGKDNHGHIWLGYLGDGNPIRPFLDDWRHEIIRRLSRGIKLPKRVDVDHS